MPDKITNETATVGKSTKRELTHPMGDNRSVASGKDFFPPTRWTVVRSACDSRIPERDRIAALDHILRVYAPALRAHIASKFRLPEDQVKDIIQGFLCDKVIGRNILSLADKQRGKLRQLLRVALDRYAISVLRKPEEKRAKASVPLEELAELTIVDEPSSMQADVEWSRALIGEAVRRMKEYCDSENRPDLWFVFEHRLLKPSLKDAEPIAYEDIVRNLALQTPAQAFNLLATAKRAFERMLRAAVGEYARTEDAVDAEIADIRGILRNARFETDSTKEGQHA